MQKIAVLSDIHIDRSSDELPGIIGELTASAGAELMILAGDVANGTDEALAGLKRIRNHAGIPVYFVAGNHDIWQSPQGADQDSKSQPDSWQAYNELLSWPENLAHGPVSLEGGWQLAGCGGWYDLGFAGREFTREQLLEMTYKGKGWADRRNTSWTGEPERVHRYFLGELRRQIRETGNPERTVAVTHVVPHASFTVPSIFPTWRFFNAYLGSGDYAELYREMNVPLAVFGHIHHRFDRTLAGTRYIGCPLGYRREWKHSDDPRRECKEAMKIIELGPEDSINETRI
ncbi:MAG: metallophosphoesterase [Spirochaetales bacterium]|nr:metallophosphoesterase [Spirochaetales bacterium]MCF7939003.1 metallophosphoesterase [Spirochaetales bacterium]